MLFVLSKPKYLLIWNVTILLPLLFLITKIDPLNISVVNGSFTQLHSVDSLLKSTKNSEYSLNESNSG